ncbi:type VII secretion target [Actinosynnema sp. NPDC050436]|uniref:type VII secretion target n=1 Tax=Actinosynnema sp. NPDC050436 TaxID=3155659 RepID=UPI0033F72D7A
MTGYEAVTGEIGALAGRVEGLADRLRAAADAARTVAMNDSAYGVVCQPFAMLLQPFEDMGVDALTKAAETVSDNAAKLRETSRAYDTQETGESARFDGMNT